MSKTDKTKPFWVKMKDGDLAWRESHDHREGPCDLPNEIDADYWHNTRCRYEWVFDGTHVCCCPMCHGDWWWDIPPNKRQRLTGKRLCRDWKREYGLDG